MALPEFLPPSLRYVVCGLNLQSDRPIPDLFPATFERPDVVITFQEHPESFQFGPQTLRYQSNELAISGKPSVRLFEVETPPLYQLVYADGTKFTIDREGSRVWSSWTTESTFEDTLTYLLGPVLGLLLRLHAVTCLHASAIAVDGVAIALTGPGGSGKSTAAAQFSRMGFPILADDIATLDQAGTTFNVHFNVHPGPARLRLWPSSVEHLYGHSEALPRLTPFWEKQYLDLRCADRLFQSTPLPLGGVYLLDSTENLTDGIVEIPRSAAMVRLVRNVYANYLLDESCRQRDFVRIANVMNTVPVRRLPLRHDFARLEQTCRSILADLDQVRSAQRTAQVKSKTHPSFASASFLG